MSERPTHFHTDLFSLHAGRKGKVGGDLVLSFSCLHCLYGLLKKESSCRWKTRETEIMSTRAPSGPDSPSMGRAAVSKRSRPHLSQMPKIRTDRAWEVFTLRSLPRLAATEMPEWAWPTPQPSKHVGETRAPRVGVSPTSLSPHSFPWHGTLAFHRRGNRGSWRRAGTRVWCDCRF